MLHQGPVTAAAFRPDGKVLLTGSDDGTARLWDTVGRMLRSFPHGSPVTSVAFAPRAKLILTGCKDGTARLWDADMSEPALALFPHTRSVTSVAFSPEGDAVLTGCEDGVARVWEVPGALPGELEQIVRWIQVFSGQELADDGEVRLLDGATLGRYRQRLEELGGPPRP
jgi:WD40 repeat protein